MEEPKVVTPPSTTNGTGHSETTCEESSTGTISHDPISQQSTLMSHQTPSDVSIPNSTSSVKEFSDADQISQSSSESVVPLGVVAEQDKERDDAAGNEEDGSMAGQHEEPDLQRASQDDHHHGDSDHSDHSCLQLESESQMGQELPPTETNIANAKSKVESPHLSGGVMPGLQTRSSTDSELNNAFQKGHLATPSENSIQQASDHIKDSSRSVNTSITNKAVSAKEGISVSHTSITKTTDQEVLNSLPEVEIFKDEEKGKGCDGPEDSWKKDEDDLECAEDALLSQLDAELDNVSEDSDLQESDLDLANGLTKEAVIEGLVDYQKIKLELEALKVRHKKKSVALERIRGENESLRDQLSDAKRVISSRDGQLKERDNYIKTHQFKNKELQVVIDQHKEDLKISREKLRGHDAAAKKAIGQLQQEMIVRVNQVKGMYEDAMKEKENMVLKYAKSEKEVLDLRKAKEAMEKKAKEAQQHVESTNIQMKQIRVELSKMRNTTMSQDSERDNFQKEIEHLKEEVNSQAIKVKWAQNKLKTELDSHKETKTKLAKTEQRLAEAKEETETIRKNCQDMIRQYQESEEVKSNSLGIQLKKTEEELQIQQQETTDQLEVHNAKLKELNRLKQAHNDATAELESLRVRVQCLEDERIQQEEILTQFKGLLNNQKDANRNLSKELDETKALEVQLTDANESIRQLEERLGNIQEDGKDLEASLDASRQKESELLQFTQKITSKNTELHSDVGLLQSKVETLTDENKSLQSQMEDITSKHSQLSTDLQREKDFRQREVTILTSRLNEKSRNEDDLTLKLEEAKDEAKTLKRRHVANTKDLTRQLQHAKKRIESLEKDGHGGKESNSMGSRTSSSGSLETAGVPSQSTSSSARGSISGPAAGEDKTSQSSQSPQVTIASGNNDFPGIDKGMLVERIIRLQRLQQKYKEKIEFHLEHNRSLVEVVQKKNKIIQGYILREETGTLSTAASDIHKAQMSKQSGIMASLYRSQASDPKMTLDLSLEINQKLQAVLEDTLLKNMTLKENIDTLGREIARLSEDLFNTKERLKTRGK
ncbi:coiled-coil domain-containing protein 186-like isoform X3 [Apostichopus japonicus]|uniref:coiled-coil domain-containing protein 186-like isoform X3 n=1 Tax=Stichopus japonicus TaxID=307972 RepID=UPI003AB5F2C1